jgi:molybdate transport system substrate-binding protein
MPWCTELNQHPEKSPALPGFFLSMAAKPHRSVVSNPTFVNPIWTTMKSLPACLAITAILTYGAIAVAGEHPASSLLVYVAGSGAGAVNAAAESYTTSTGQAVDIVKGPAGLLRRRIEQGADADIYISADMANPQALAAQGKASPPVVVAHNTLCLIARRDVGLSADNVLDKLLDPSVKIGTSTPGNDPGGDYAWAVFSKADSVHPGARSTLSDKAQKLVGGTAAPSVPLNTNPVEYFLTSRKVDVFFSYCSSKKNVTDPTLTSVPIPPHLAVAVDYGMVVLIHPHDSERRKVADRFVRYLLSPAAQQQFASHGLIPVAAKPRP